MDKIKIKLNRDEWITLTALVLQASANKASFELLGKNLCAMNIHLIKDVYIKLHNRMHSLKPKKVNLLSLTVPEAAAFNVYFQSHFQFSGLSLAIVTEITGLIDQKLT
jgi:disulfide bond formation protein DsbB